MPTALGVGLGVGVGVGVGVGDGVLPPPPPPHPIPAVSTASTMRLSNPLHLRRRPGNPNKKTHAIVAPPLTANQPMRAEIPGLTELLAGVEALMVSVAVVFPLTVTDVGLRLQVTPVGAVHARPTEALKPLMEPRLNVAVPVAPAATVTVGVCTTMEKSEAGLVSDNVVCEGV